MLFQETLPHSADKKKRYLITFEPCLIAIGSRTETPKETHLKLQYLNPLELELIPRLEMEPGKMHQKDKHMDMDWTFCAIIGLALKYLN